MDINIKCYQNFIKFKIIEIIYNKGFSFLIMKHFNLDVSPYCSSITISDTQKMFYENLNNSL